MARKPAAFQARPPCNLTGAGAATQGPRQSAKPRTVRRATGFQDRAEEAVTLLVQKQQIVAPWARHLDPTVSQNKKLGAHYAKTCCRK